MKLETLAQLLGYARPHRRTVIACICLLAVESAVSLALPWLGGTFAVTVFDPAQVVPAGIVLALLFFLVAQATLRFTTSYLTGKLSSRMLVDLKVRLYAHLLRLPLTTLQRQPHGETMALLSQAVAQLSGFACSSLLRIVPLGILVAGAIALMIRIDGVMTGLVLVTIPAIYALSRALGKKLRPLRREILQADAAAMAAIDQGLRQSLLIKLSTQEDFELNQVQRKLSTVLEVSDREHLLSSLLEPAVQATAAVLLVALLWFLSSSGVVVHLNQVDLIRFLLYSALLARPIGALASFYGQAQMAFGSLDRINAVLAAPTEPRDVGSRDLPPAPRSISFEDVWFSYPQREPTLKGLTLTIAGGETVALTGLNGEGKSTFAHLLLRLFEPDQGRILIDHLDVKSIELDCLRRQIILVPQQVQMIDGSVADNIAYGAGDITQDAIEDAAKIAQAYEFITRLPMGFHTLIGDDGIRLSGGQRQRVALARALVRNPRILLLDEATSMFDAEGEAAFVGLVRGALQQCTVIIITHRQATIALADRVIRLTEGTAT